MNYYYVTNHGIGLGTIPDDLHLGESLEIVDDSTMKSYFRTSRELTKSELDFYDINRWCPKCKRVYLLYPAISRDDNATCICPDCGKEEAISSFLNYERSITNE